MRSHDRPHESTPTPIPVTLQERRDLLKLAQLRERVAKGSVAQHKASLLANFEEALAREYYWSTNEVWSQAYQRATAVVEAANEEIRAECRRLRIPPTFAPHITPHWYERGENRVAARREELRKAARARADAMAKAALAAIGASSARVQEEILVQGLTGDAAGRLLESMPTASQLMPPITVRELLPPGERLEEVIDATVGVRADDP